MIRSTLLWRISEFQIELVKILILTSAVYFAFTWIKKRRRIAAVMDKIPGPKPRFLVGNLDVLGVFKTTGDRYKDLEKLLLNVVGLTKLYKSGILRLWAGIMPVVCVYKYSTLETLMNNHALGEKTAEYKLLVPMMGKGLVTSSVEKNRKRRKLIMPALSFRLLDDFVEVFNHHSRLTVEKLYGMLDDDYVEVVQLMTLCALNIICETAMGIRLDVKNEDELEYSKSVSEIEKMVLERGLRPWLWPDLFYYMSSRGKRFRKMVNVMNNFTRKVIEERKKLFLKEKGIPVARDDSEVLRKPVIPFLDILLTEYMKNKDFTEEDIMEEVNTFMAAGFDTTTMGLSWTLYLIGLNQEVQEKIQEELDVIFGDDLERPVTMEDMKDMKYLDCVIKEAQRLYPSISLIGRKITENICIDGYKIPKGISCYVFLFALHRDSEIFPNPEVFDPDRFLPENATGRHPLSFIPFAAGSRSCVGQKFSILEEKTVLAHILRNFSVTSLDPRDSVLPYADIALRTRHPVRLKFIARHVK